MHAQTIVVRDDKKGDPHEVDVLADYPVAAKIDSCLEKTIKSTLKETFVSLIILSL